MNITYLSESLTDIEEMISRSSNPRKAIEEFRDAIQLIEKFPEIAAQEDGIREYILKRLPYKICYLIRDHDLLIVAVAHTKRRHYWIDRLE
jgi:plasmid stabilization system protein ParE